MKFISLKDIPALFPESEEMFLGLVLTDGMSMSTAMPRTTIPAKAVDPKTAKEVLAVIDKFFLTNGKCPQSQKLWDVLCALRGPDQEEFTIKSHSTSFIRQAALPSAYRLFSTKTSLQTENDKCEIVDPDGARAKELQSANFDAQHFYKHIQDACSALDLGYTYI